MTAPPEAAELERTELSAGQAPATPGRALQLGDLALIALAGLLFLVLSYLPLGTGIWGHLAYGSWILDHRRLPAQDPFLPLAEGMPVATDGWLSQALLAASERLGGVEAVALLLALVGLASWLILGLALRRASGSKPASLAGLLLALALSWPQLTAFGPARLGMLCFAILLWLVAGAAWPPSTAATAGRRLWLAVPLLFALWANLDGSFVWGLAVLASCLAGRALEVGWQGRSLRRLLTDRALRRWVWVLELAVAATLLNPRGIDLLLGPLGLAAGGLASGTWAGQPLAFRGLGGWAFAASWVLVLLALRHSRRPVPVGHGLLLALFGLAAAARVAVLGWYGPVLAMVLTPHLAELTRRWWPVARGKAHTAAHEGDATRLSAGSRWRRRLIAGLLVWIVFALSPAGSALLGRQGRSARQLIGQELPVPLAAALRARPPAGLLLAPPDWAFWLMRVGPAGLKPFAATSPTRLPARVWEDYGEVLAVGSRWERILERHRIAAVVADKARAPRLVTALRFSPEWAATWEDGRALLAIRASDLPAIQLEDGHAGEAPVAAELPTEGERP